MLIDDGDFLVRESSSGKAQFVLSGIKDGHFKHLLLVDPYGKVGGRRLALVRAVVLLLCCSWLLFAARLNDFSGFKVQLYYCTMKVSLQTCGVRGWREEVLWFVK